MITTPASPHPRRSLFKKQIPTLLGLFILIIGLGIGAVLFSQGTSIFLPRATPETTPKSIRVSNVTESGFTLTFLTDEPTAGFIKAGSDPKKLTQYGDQRDQITGAVGEYTLHHITIARGLDPDTTYHYVLGTGKGSLFDDDGKPFTVKTAKKAGTQPKALTVFGSASLPAGGPAEGSVVFVTAPNASTLSSLVTAAGSWAVSLSSARTADGSSYAKVAEGDTLQIQVQATDPKDDTKLTAVVTAEKPIDIKLGEGVQTTAQVSPSPSPSPSPTSTPTPAMSPSPSASSSAMLPQSATSQSASPSSATAASGPGVLSSKSSSIASSSASLTAAANASATATVVDLTKVDTGKAIVVDTTQPTIVGKVKPNVIVSIEIHSETQITDEVTADANGNFEIDIEEYSKNLEPGEHTITYSYVDPNSGQTVTVTRTFTVAPKTSTVAASPSPSPRTSPSPTPYSSSNLYPVPTASSSASSSSTSAIKATKTPTPRPATGSGTGTGSGQLMNSGSVGVTFLLLAGGLFFLISGIWSWWISQELAKEYQE